MNTGRRSARPDIEHTQIQVARSAPSGPVRVGIGQDCELVTVGLRESLRPFASRVEVPDFERGVPDGLDLLLQDPGLPVGKLRFDDLADLADIGSPRLVAFGWTAEPAEVRRALGRGAVAYLSKQLPAARLVAAIECIVSGQRLALDAAGTPVPLDALRGSQLTAGLSHREIEILTLIAEGLTNAEIAARVFASVNTVKTYIRSAYRKIGVTRRSQAVAWHLRHAHSPGSAERPDGRYDGHSREISAWALTPGLRPSRSDSRLGRRSRADATPGSRLHDDDGALSS